MATKIFLSSGVAVQNISVTYHGPVAVVDDQAVSLGLELLIGADQRFRSRALKKCARLGIQRSSQKIIRSRVTHVELDRGIELDQLHQFRLAETSLLLWRLLLERLRAQLGRSGAGVGYGS